MSTQNYQTVLDHTTDAGFRAWGAAFKAHLIAVGLTNTADTGQIDWTTVTRPATNTYAGYEIYRFNDSLQGSAPIFIRFDYGTGSNASNPLSSVSVGTSTDGAGNLNNTGAFSTFQQPWVQDNTPGVTAYPTYICYSAAQGFLGIAWKLGAFGLSTPGVGFLMLGRSCDATGAPTGTGATLVTGFNNPALMQALRFPATAQGYAQHQNYGQVIGNVLSSIDGVNVQAYLLWTQYPRVEPINWGFMVITAEFGRVLVATPVVGSVAHTYLALGANSPYAGQGSNDANYSFAMLYE